MRLIHFLRSSVRGRLALLVGAITAPALLLVALMVFQSYRNERRAVGHQLIVTARAMASVVDYQIAHSESILKELAASADLAAGDYAAFYARAKSQVDAADRWIVLEDAASQQLVNTRLPWGSQLPRTPVIAERDHAVRLGRTFISNVIIGATLKRPVVYVSLPILERGALKYTLSYALFPSAFAAAMHPERFSTDMVVSILDREGTIVARHPNGEDYTGEKATPDIVASILSHQEGQKGSVTLEGTPVLAVHSRAPVSGWSVALGAPLAGIFASTQRLLWLGLTASALVMTTAFLVAVWIGRAVVRGVDTLVVGTEQIGRGETPAAISSGLAETDFVGDALRKSALRLKQRDDENARLAQTLQEELEQRRRSEESAQRLAAIVETSDDAIISTDLTATITSWNGGAERLYGYRAEEIVGRSISTLIPPERKEEEELILQRILRGERINHFETARRRKDGKLVPISLTVSPLFDREGQVVGASKIARDISARQRAESQQQALYELIARVSRAEALPEIFDAALDALGRCIDAHRSAILLYDGQGVMRFVASRRLSDEYRRAVEGHSPWRPEETQAQPVLIEDIATADLAPSSRVAVETEGIRALAFVPLTYERRLLGKFMVYFDEPHLFSAGELRPVETIASQVAFAIERQRGASALEALVNERTASLQQAVAQMEEFSYSVSHDLRAPVRAMRGYADMILQDHGWRLDNDARDLLARVIRNAGRMDRLILDLLTYSRTSRRELKLEPVSLDKLVRDVVQQYPDMRPEHADIVVEGQLPDVMAHEPSLTQVLSNLLSNAVKFIPPNGRPQVRISADQREAQARLWIADNGIGIKPEHQTRLFGMFERVHPDRTYEGTGIGLAIVRKAVERMNGTVGVESDGVSGSRFWFELPLANGRPDSNGNGHG